jgi:hypothetical protein
MQTAPPNLLADYLYLRQTAVVKQAIDTARTSVRQADIRRVTCASRIAFLPLKTGAWLGPPVLAFATIGPEWWHGGYVDGGFAAVGAGAAIARFGHAGTGFTGMPGGWHTARSRWANTWHGGRFGSEHSGGSGAWHAGHFGGWRGGGFAGGHSVGFDGWHGGGFANLRGGGFGGGHGGGFGGGHGHGR